ncbi:TPA: hypothetical protein ACH3X3_005149 [Trebouxia sp. C0006]
MPSQMHNSLLCKYLWDSADLGFCVNSACAFPPTSAHSLPGRRSVQSRMQICTVTDARICRVAVCCKNLVAKTCMKKQVRGKENKKTRLAGHYMSTAGEATGKAVCSNNQR